MNITLSTRKPKRSYSLVVCVGEYDPYTADERFSSKGEARAAAEEILEDGWRRGSPVSVSIEDRFHRCCDYVSTPRTFCV